MGDRSESYRSIGREEAFLVLRGFAESRTLVRVSCSFAAMAARFMARVTVVSEDKVSLMAEDLESECVIALGRVVAFVFDDLRNWPREGETFDRMLYLFFVEQVDDDEPEQIVLAEVREPRRSSPIT